MNQDNGTNGNNGSGKISRKWYFWVFVALLFALVLANIIGETLAPVFYALLAGLTPIVLGLVLTFLLKGPVVFLERTAFKNSFSKCKRPEYARRIVSLIIVFLVAILLIAFFLVTFVPAIVEVVQEIAANIDTYVAKIENELAALLANLPFLESLNVHDIVSQMVSEVGKMLESLDGNIVSIVANIFSTVLSVLGVIVISLFFAFFFIKDKEKIAGVSKRVTYAWLGKEKGDDTVRLANKANRILIDYTVSKLIEAVIIFITVSTALILLGSPMPFLLALLMAVLNVIPYVGPIIAIIPTFLLTMVLQSVSTALLACAIVLLIVIFVTGFITPIIVGSRMKLDMILVVISIVIGGAMGGLLGMIIAPPVIAILMIYFKIRLERKEKAMEAAKSDSQNSPGPQVALVEFLDADSATMVAADNILPNTKHEEKPDTENDIVFLGNHVAKPKRKTKSEDIKK